LGIKIKRAAIVLEVLFVGPRKRPPDGHYSKTLSKSPETTVGTETPLNFLRAFSRSQAESKKRFGHRNSKNKRMTHVSILFDDSEVLTSTSTINIGEPKNL